MTAFTKNTAAAHGQEMTGNDPFGAEPPNGGGTIERVGEPMKALSIQPWAWLIVNGHKDIENRDWRCHLRGPVLIHAGKKVDRDAMQDLLAGRHPVTGQLLRLDLPKVFETGGIVGEATIAGCVARSASPWFVGRWGILMRDARPLPFQPCKGSLGFFVPPLVPADALDIAQPEVRHG